MIQKSIYRMTSSIFNQIGYLHKIQLKRKHHNGITMPKVILNVATSMDDFIADVNGGVDWLPGEDSDPDDSCGMRLFKNDISVIVMGSTSYQQILTFGEWAWPDKLTYVFTSQADLVSENQQIRFVHDTPEDCIETIKWSAKDKNIWLLGGAKLAHAFFRQHLIDEVILTVIPILLGNGIKLNIPCTDFDLASETHCAGGMTRRRYEKKLSLKYKAGIF
ncbi:MAG: dihydrofolate reductase [Candidatus Puniceispirillum sp.]|nr:dihydrofolate reductase [Candidatus Puniceispirillum sp.]